MLELSSLSNINYLCVERIVYSMGIQYTSVCISETNIER